MALGQSALNTFNNGASAPLFKENEMEMNQTEWLNQFNAYNLRKKSALNDLMMSVMQSTIDPARKTAMMDVLIELIAGVDKKASI